MTLQYYAGFGIEGGAFELIPCATRDEARKIARDRLGPLLKSTDDDVVFSCVYSGPPGANTMEGLEELEELWRGGS